ncbi:translation elongation factor Ts [bacterium]|nr:translation elongation factor Ts [bacterium]
MEITAASIQALRKATGAGMMDCKRAMEEAAGDADKATEILRKKGIMRAAKRQDRETREGRVYSYIHMGGKIGVLVEVNCETDFVARTEDFAALCKDISMHIAASSPDVVDRTVLPTDQLDKEKEIYRAQASESGKPEAVLDKIVEGRVEKYYQEVCLIDQPFVKNPEVSVGEMIKNAAAKFGEHIQVRRFARFELGR